MSAVALLEEGHAGDDAEIAEWMSGNIASRALTLALTALVALALDRALASYADGVQWTRATPGRVDHHRRAQLRRSRHHPARRHRAPLAVRLEDRLA